MTEIKDIEILPENASYEDVAKGLRQLQSLLRGTDDTLPLDLLNIPGIADKLEQLGRPDPSLLVSAYTGPLTMADGSARRMAIGMVPTSIGGATSIDLNVQVSPSLGGLPAAYFTASVRPLTHWNGFRTAAAFAYKWAADPLKEGFVRIENGGVAQNIEVFWMAIS